MIVTNTGSRKGDEVVQLYVHQDYTSLKRPVEQLEGFKRITLNPGEKQTVQFSIGFDQVKFWKAGRWQMEPGKLTCPHWLIVTGYSTYWEHRFELSQEANQSDEITEESRGDRLRSPLPCGPRH